jgi:DNA-directed RNA polymerase specialized sigma24 family protein
MKLEDLREIAVEQRLLNLSAVAKAAGMSIDTLNSRIRRGGPELTDEEAKAIRRAILPIKQLMI